MLHAPAARPSASVPRSAIRFRRLPVPVLAASCLVATTVLFAPGNSSADPGDAPITGEVFRDYDADGVRDALEPGFADYTVTAYDSAGGSSIGTVDADGSYEIDITAVFGGADGYRVEFTDLPAFVQPGPFGPDSGTTVQFVGAGGVADLGVLNPAQYCGDNPQIATTCFQGGTAAADGPAVIDFVYEAGTTSTTSNDDLALTPHPSRATDDQVGPVRGLAYHRDADVIFAAAYAKRHTAYPGASAGSPNDDGPDTIYLVPRDGSAPTPFVTIEAGDDNHDYANLIADTAFWNDVGRTGFGDIDLSEDESTLYAANMFDKLIYAIPVDDSGAVPTAGTPTSIDLGALTEIGTDCTGGTWVPGAIKANDGLVYLSATCIADAPGATTDLQGFVYAYDPVGGSATEVANFPLDYAREWVSRSGTTIADAEYQPWVDAEPARQDAPGVTPPSQQVAPPGGDLGPFGQSYYPQPWLTDIEFDEGGNMIVGVTDRFGDQFGNDNAGAGAGNGEGVSGGDTVRLTPAAGGWQLSPVTDDEFYGSDEYLLASATPTHAEISLGHLAVLLGRGEVIAPAFDPAPVGGTVPAPGGGEFDQSFRSGGLIWMSHADGSRTRSYQVFGFDEPGTFGKAAGIGDIELICESAPLEIGNYVWLDSDGDGIQDPDETSLAGVTMNLYADDGTTLLATVVTDANGQYYFNDATPANGGGTLTVAPDTNYVIRVDNPTDYEVGGPLAGLGLTVEDQGSDLADSDAVTTAGFPQIDVLTGGPGENDHTLDVGFEPKYRLGSLVWEDLDDDGVAEPGETPIPGVTVELLDSGGAVIDTTVTDGDGEYEFDGLDAGNYQVRIPGGQAPLDGFRTSGVPDGTADNGDDNDNNGVEDGADWTSGSVELGDGDGADEPTGEANGITGASNEDGAYPDDRSNQTVDFGFFDVPSVSVGDFVFIDENRDGIQDSGDTPVPGATLTLTGPDGQPVTDVFGNPVPPIQTDTDGEYSFDDLPILEPGESYTVTIDPSTAPTLDGFTPTEPGQGTPATDSSTGSASSGDLTEDGDRDDTLDFGFIPSEPTLPTDSVSVGDFVFIDENRDGIQDSGDTPVPGATLTLTGPDGQPVTDVFGNPVPPIQTDTDGEYSFDDLPILEPGESYTVTIDPSTAPTLFGHVPTVTGEGSGATDSSTGSASSGDLTEDGDRDPTLDFGFVPGSVSVGDFVFIDVNRDGIQNTGDAPAPGATLTLTGPDGGPVTDIFGNPVGPTTTDINGLYTFDDLPILAPGESYTVTIDPTTAPSLAGLLPTQTGQGTSATDSSSGSASSTGLTMDGDRDPTLDFGFVIPDDQLPATGDSVWASLRLALLAVGVGLLLLALAGSARRRRMTNA